MGVIGGLLVGCAHISLPLCGFYLFRFLRVPPALCLYRSNGLNYDVVTVLSRVFLAGLLSTNF